MHDVSRPDVKPEVRAALGERMRQTRRATPDLSSFVVDSGLLKGASPDQVRRKHVGQPKERLNGTTLTASASSPSLSGSSPSYRRTRMAPIDESSRAGPSRLADPAEHGPEPASPQEMAWHGMHSTYIRSTPAVLYPAQSPPTPRSCALFSGDAFCLSLHHHCALGRMWSAQSGGVGGL